MSYTSLSFIIFVAITGIVYFLIPQKYRWISLLAGSYIFYAINSKFLTAFILISTATLYIFGKLIEKKNLYFKEQKQLVLKEERKALKTKVAKKKKALLTYAVLINIGILLVLKYSGFFANSFNGIVACFGGDFALPIMSFALPLGISYYTLTGISYITDVYRGTIKAETNPFKLALFLAFFPQIVEGPFSRYGDLSPTIFKGEKFNYDRFISGFIRILYGFIKKLVIADRAAFFVNSAFDLTSYDGITVIFAVILYTVQIYAEFSGCMDIVCGICEILGINLPENFNQPFFSKSIDEFWRRWHITLGAWLRDYVFYSVSFSKIFKNINQKSKEKLGSYFGNLVPIAFALFFVWFANGFWHGASWKYVIYGLYYYAIMMVGKLFKPATDKLSSSLKINTQSKPYIGFQIIRTDIIVCIGMLIFRSPNLTQGYEMFKSIFTSMNFNVLVNNNLFNLENFEFADLAVVSIGVLALFIIGLLKEKSISVRNKIVHSNSIVKACCLLALIFTLIIFGIYGDGAGNSSFIYGQF